MADMYSFNGHKLPALPAFPEGCAHAVIYYNAEDNCYYLFCCSEPFVYNENNVPQVPSTVRWGGNACYAGSSYWGSATFTPENADADNYLLNQELLWTNTDIYKKDTDTVVLAATTPLQYPTITSVSNSKTYTLGEEAEALVCEANVFDGELSYQWYHGEEVVSEESSYTPDVSTVGSESYYCIVTNTVSGTELTTTSRTITIKVAEAVKKCNIVTYVMGLVARMCSRRTEIPVASAAEPTAYLYNGIRLPALPEWDRGVYPYAFVTWTKSSSSATAFLYCSTVPIYKNDETSLFAYVIAKENGSMICYACTTWPDGEIFEDWHRFEDGDKAVTAETKFTVLQTGAIKWANHDMLNYSDDSVYLAKSEPVPVYE